MTIAEIAARLAGQVPVLLGWRPDEFWRATPAELAAIFAELVPQSVDVLDRDALKKMMENFPDG